MNSVIVSTLSLSLPKNQEGGEVGEYNSTTHFFTLPPPPPFPRKGKQMQQNYTVVNVLPLRKNRKIRFKASATVSYVSLFSLSSSPPSKSKGIWRQESRPLRQNHIFLNSSPLTPPRTERQGSRLVQRSHTFLCSLPISSPFPLPVISNSKTGIKARVTVPRVPLFSPHLFLPPTRHKRTERQGSRLV